MRLIRPAIARLSMAVLLLASVPRLWGYAEDKGTGQDLHSTFHYNLVRTLARAAGFTAEEAEKIAVACELPDRADAGFKNFYLYGTERPAVDQGQQAIGLYYHFGRRGAKNATGEYALPGGGDTCQYFDPAYIAGTTLPNNCPLSYLQLQGSSAAYAGQPGPCEVNDEGKVVSEIEEIELWAVYGRGLPRFGAPKIARGKSGTQQAVQPRSLDALGIYLHSLADSYSHEACMKQCSFQGHSVGPPVCTATYWHQIAEYGPISGQNSGVTFTRNAGYAVWQALAAFRKTNGFNQPPLWNGEAARKFIDDWVALNTSAERETAADDAFKKLGS